MPDPAGATRAFALRLPRASAPGTLPPKGAEQAPAGGYGVTAFPAPIAAIIAATRSAWAASPDFR